MGQRLNRLKRIESALKEITGQEWSVRVEWDASEAKSGEDPKPEAAVAKAVTYREREQEVAKIPLVSRAIEKMGARLLKLDDGFGSGKPEAAESDSAEPQEP